MIITGDQIVGHLLGDYVLQSGWLASNKVNRTVVSILHAVIYTAMLCGWLALAGVDVSAVAIAVMASSHAVIDRLRAAKYLIFLTEHLAPKKDWRRWESCIRRPGSTGHPKELPPFMAVWLMIIVDNTLHLVINGLSINFL